MIAFVYLSWRSFLPKKPFWVPVTRGAFGFGAPARRSFCALPKLQRTDYPKLPMAELGRTKCIRHCCKLPVSFPDRSVSLKQQSSNKGPLCVCFFGGLFIRFIRGLCTTERNE